MQISGINLGDFFADVTVTIRPDDHKDCALNANLVCEVLSALDYLVQNEEQDILKQLMTTGANQALPSVSDPVLGQQVQSLSLSWYYRAFGNEDRNLTLSDVAALVIPAVLQERDGRVVLDDTHIRAQMEGAAHSGGLTLKLPERPQQWWALLGGRVL